MDITRVMVHCSDSPQGRGDDAATIHAWHKERGFDGVGYHAVITEDGTVQAGRPEYWQGAHVKGHNRESLGVCLIGRDSFTDEQLDALFDYLVDVCNRHPRAVVYGHRDLDDGKDCPGFDVTEWLESKHDEIASGKKSFRK